MTKTFLYEDKYYKYYEIIVESSGSGCLPKGFKTIIKEEKNKKKNTENLFFGISRGLTLISFFTFLYLAVLNFDTDFNLAIVFAILSISSPCFLFIENLGIKYSGGNAE